MAVIIILLFVLTMISHSYAIVSDIGSLPPSKHIMCYEQFIKDNSYAGEFISINAKIRRIESVKPGDLGAYKIVLMSLNETTYTKFTAKNAYVIVKHKWRYSVTSEKMFIVDEEIGMPLTEGDNIVIVGRAGRFIGMKRNITVDEGGTIILLLKEDEYEKRKEMISCDVKEIVKGVYAIGSYDLSKLEGNPNLLDSDRDGLISPVDPDPNVFNERPPEMLDSDDDGLSDEVDPCPYKFDCDDDGLNDKEEIDMGTDPKDNDTDDDDELSDGDEIKRGTDPKDEDTDNDGLSDGEEALGRSAERTGGPTDPLNPDTDGDGIPDANDKRQDINYPPKISIKRRIIGDEDEILEEGERLEIKYGANDENGISSIMLYIDGNLVESHSPQKKSCEYSFESDPLSKGKHEIKVEAVDMHPLPKRKYQILNVTAERTGPCVYFQTTKRKIKVREDAIFTLVAVNLADKEMNVTLLLKPPSGLSVTGTGLAKIQSGVYGGNYLIKPGEEKSIYTHVIANEAGEYDVKAEVRWGFKGEGVKIQYYTLKLIVEPPLSPAPSPSPTPSPMPTPSPTPPGFEEIFVFASIFTVLFLRKRKRWNVW